MNIIEAMEQLKAGKAIQRTGWGNAKIQAVQLENGQYQIFASGDLTPEMLVLLSGDYDVKEEKETNDVKETEEAVSFERLSPLRFLCCLQRVFWALVQGRF